MKRKLISHLFAERLLGGTACGLCYKNTVVLVMSHLSRFLCFDTNSADVVWNHTRAKVAGVYEENVGNTCVLLLTLLY